MEEAMLCYVAKVVQLINVAWVDHVFLSCSIDLKARRAVLVQFRL